MFGNNVASKYPSQYIRRGDKIYVRIIQDYKNVCEFSVENVDSYTSLIGEIRYVARNLKGLAKVFIRNHSRGWSEERPIMFYQGMPAPRRRAVTGTVRTGALCSSKRMLAPWETH